MRRVALPGAGVVTSALGFGCAQLMARTSRADSIRLLETAFDAGITHFDVARSYGYGEAESALGAFAAHRRDRITITTKLGIEPPRHSRALAGSKTVARAALNAVPALRGVARRGASTLNRPGRFDVPAASASLDTSLRELGTDHVDLLLLHEARPGDLSDDLLAFLDNALSAGKIGAFGIATQADATRAILAEAPRFAEVVQVANSMTAPLEGVEPRAMITHSPLLGLEELGERTGRRRLAQLMLAWACSANPGGVVLFSSRDPGHIRSNAALELSDELVLEARAYAASISRQ